MCNSGIFLTVIYGLIKTFAAVIKKGLRFGNPYIYFEKRR
jgi:hypothetical protein